MDRQASKDSKRTSEPEHTLKGELGSKNFTNSKHTTKERQRRGGGGGGEGEGGGGGGGRVESNRKEKEKKRNY